MCADAGLDVALLPGLHHTVIGGAAAARRPAGQRDSRRTRFNQVRSSHGLQAEIPSQTATNPLPNRQSATSH
jgi:hypothetical protein